MPSLDLAREALAPNENCRHGFFPDPGVLAPTAPISVAPPLKSWDPPPVNPIVAFFFEHFRRVGPPRLFPPAGPPSVNSNGPACFLWLDFHKSFSEKVG